MVQKFKFISYTFGCLFYLKNRRRCFVGFLSVLDGDTFSKDYAKCDLLFLRGFENGIKYFSSANTYHALLQPFPSILLSFSLSLSLSLFLYLSLSLFPSHDFYFSLSDFLIPYSFFYFFPFFPQFLNESERRWSPPVDSMALLFTQPPPQHRVRTAQLVAH